jgi:hypothetical protein
MTVQATSLNTHISNISSWFSNYSTPTITTTQRTNGVVIGNPNKPAVLNHDPNAGPIVTKEWSF